MKCTTFEDLLALGTEKIHERTHISRDKIELVLTKSFAEVGKVQFMGYVSILEREYGIDLQDLREEYAQFYQTHAGLMAPKESVILQSVSSSKPKWVFAGLLVIAVLMGGGYLLQMKMSSEPKEEVMKLTTLAVEVVEDIKELNTTQSDESNETNGSVQVPVNEANLTTTALAPMKSGNTIVIRPNYKLWYGMIDMATGARIQKITADPITIDTSKNWLIFLGHGRVEIESGNEKNILKEKETVRFLCENGVLKQISRDQFIERNGGKNW